MPSGSCPRHWPRAAARLLAASAAALAAAVPATLTAAPTTPTAAPVIPTGASGSLAAAPATSTAAPASLTGASGSLAAVPATSTAAPASLTGAVPAAGPALPNGAWASHGAAGGPWDTQVSWGAPAPFALPAGLRRQPSSEAPTDTSAPPVPEARCVVRDNRLAELSGLAADGVFRYAVGDGGRRLEVLVLRRDCTVARVITAAIDPFDIEDLAIDNDGRLWLADIGDNDRQRSTVALHVLSQNGAPQLYRLTYPDGPHDAEALLLGDDATPYIVTKEGFGASSVYRPAGPLTPSGPTPLELVTSVRFPRTDTPGGPLGSVGSAVITGGATSADGTVVALRTYTDAYLFPVHDGDIVDALGGKPVRLPLPDEPQGEAIAFEPDGTLLSGSERADSGPQPLRAVAGAASLAAPQPSQAGSPAPTQGQPEGTSAPAKRLPLSDWQAVLVSVIGAAAIVFIVTRLVRRRRA